jgi:hypothetical protein
MGLMSPGARLTKPMAQGIRAYHGSPYKFDKFSLDKIGTGEGAQAYGHGLYFAENPAVAKQYAGMPNSHLPRPTDSAHVAAAKDFIAHGMDPHKGLKAAYKDITTREIEAAVVEARGGYKPNLYKVDIDDNAIPKMLDWDKPLSQQQPDVLNRLTATPALRSTAKLERDYLSQLRPEAQRIASKMIRGDESARVGDSAWSDWQKLAKLAPKVDHNAIHDIATAYSPTGADIYRKLGWVTDGSRAPQAAESLKKAGIPGIRYLDGGSRTGGAGTSNFVMFDDALVKILERM